MAYNDLAIIQTSIKDGVTPSDNISTQAHDIMMSLTGLDVEFSISTGGDQPTPFPAHVTESFNKVTFSRNSYNGQFSISTNATIDGIGKTSPLTITQDMDGKTLTITTSGTNFKTVIQTINLHYHGTPSGQDLSIKVEVDSGMLAELSGNNLCLCIGLGALNPDNYPDLVQVNGTGPDNTGSIKIALSSQIVNNRRCVCVISQDGITILSDYVLAYSTVSNYSSVRYGVRPNLISSSTMTVGDWGTFGYGNTLPDSWKIDATFNVSMDGLTFLQSYNSNLTSYYFNSNPDWIGYCPSPGVNLTSGIDLKMFGEIEFFVHK